MRRRQLGAELRRLRDQARISPGRAALELDCSEAKIRHMENGRNAPTKPDLTVLAGLYKLDGAVHADLEEARQEASEKGWWASYRLPNSLANYVGMESDAVKASNFELELVPGLLQTEAYARAVHESPSHLVPRAQVERWVAARMKRQERLSGDDPLELHALLSEGVLRRMTGSAFAVEQFRALIAASGKPNVTIQVLPFSAGIHPSMSGGFTRLDFPPEMSNPIGWLESVIGGQMLDDPKNVLSLADRFTELSQLALTPEESVGYINDWI